MQRQRVKSLEELGRGKKRKKNAPDPKQVSSSVQASPSKVSVPVNKPPVIVTSTPPLVVTSNEPGPNRNSTGDEPDKGREKLSKTIAAKTSGPPPAPGAFVSEIGPSQRPGSVWSPMLMKWDVSLQRQVPVLTSDIVQNCQVTLAVSRAILLPKDMKSVRKLDRRLQRDSGISFALSISQYFHDMYTTIVNGEKENRGLATARDLALSQVNESRNSLNEVHGENAPLKTTLTQSEKKITELREVELEAHECIQKSNEEVSEITKANQELQKELSEVQTRFSTEIKLLQDQLVS